MGILLLGKLESGCIFRNQTFLLMPNRVSFFIRENLQVFIRQISVVFTCLFILSFVTFKDSVKIMQIFSDDIEVDQANPGENLKLKVTGVEEEVKFMRYHEFKWSWKLFTVFSLIWEIIFPLFLLTIYKYILIVKCSNASLWKGFTSISKSASVMRRETICEKGKQWKYVNHRTQSLLIQI